jgi:acyl carrier protein
LPLRRTLVAVNEKIRSFILENVLAGSRGATLNDNDSFLEKGIIDSTGILELVSFIEDEFKIQVRDEELVPDNFDSVSKLAGYITTKISS